MRFTRLVVPIALFVIIVAGAFTVYYVSDYGAASAAQQPEFVDNESISQQVGLWQFVNKATEEHTAGFNESVTVYNASGVELEKGVDYEWNATDGSINYNNTASVTDGNVGNISYTYFENTQGVKILSGPIGAITEGLGLMGLLAGGLALVVFLLVVAGLFAKLFGSSGPKSNR